MEAVTKLDVDLARKIPVESAEGEAVVVEHALVGDVESRDRGGEAFGEILAEGKIEGGVGRQVVALVWLTWDAGLSVAEAGAVVDIRRGVRAPG